MMVLVMGCAMGKYATAQGIVVGAKAGLHFPDLVDQNNQWNFETDLGIQAGIVLMVYSSDLFALQPELMFTQVKGSGQKLVVSETDSVRSGLYYDLKYWQVPLLGRFSFGNKVRASVFTGPTIGLLWQKSASFEQNTFRFSGESSAEKSDLSAIVHDFNISLTLGAAVEYNNVFVEFRYDRGLTNVLSHEGSSFGTRNLSVSGGYVLYF